MERRTTLGLALVVVLALAAGVLVVVAIDPTDLEPGARDAVPAGPSTTAPAEEAAAAVPTRQRARIARRTALRSSPGGPVVGRAARRTRFGGLQILTVVAREGPWIGVLHHRRRGGRPLWVHDIDVQLLRRRWRIVVDRSERRAVVLREGRVVQRFPVTIGRPGFRTPVGRYGITDRLVPRGASPYGCCILALTGRQAKLPPGWPGGDRLALHGSADGTVGRAASAGCVRVRNRDLERVFDRVPVGSRVDVRA